MLIFSFNFLIVHRRRKTRCRKYEPSNSNKCCSLGNSTFLQNVFPEAGNGCCIKHYFWSADSSKALPATGIILGSMIGIGMTLNSDPFLLFRNCRGSCDEYRYMITPNVSSVKLVIFRFWVYPNGTNKFILKAAKWMENISGGGTADFIVSSSVKSLLLYHILRGKAASGIWYAYVYLFIRQTLNIFFNV